jgi:hypothetical protein
MQNQNPLQDENNSNPVEKIGENSRSSIIPNAQEVLEVKQVDYKANKKLTIILFALLVIVAGLAIIITNRNTEKYRESIQPKNLLLPTPTTNPTKK